MYLVINLALLDVESTLTYSSLHWCGWARSIAIYDDYTIPFRQNLIFKHIKYDLVCSKGTLQNNEMSTKFKSSNALLLKKR